MQRYKITHVTEYAFSSLVQLMPHTLRLRPREGHELRLENSLLEISPPALLHWHRDVEGNSVAVATFNQSTSRLRILSELVIQQYDQEPLNFLIAEYAVDHPFQYEYQDQISLSPYLNNTSPDQDNTLADWLSGVGLFNGEIQSMALLSRLNININTTLYYQRREEEGVQTAQQTLILGSGSCRDFASLFIEAARKLGFAARFVSGYLNTNTLNPNASSTHAWAEVFLPGAGWKGFDPTLGLVVGADHIAVAVAREPDMIPPVSGSFLGPPGSSLTVSVEVRELV